MLTLHDFELSGNCYKVRLLLGLLGLPYECRAVDFAGGEHRRPAFLALNPFGQVPVLEDDGFVLRDSQAILIYLASRHGGSAWWPQEPARLGEITAWLSTAANEVAQGPNALRLARKFGYAIDEARARAVCESTLGLIEAHLAECQWMVGERVSIADLALYPYLALAPEGGVELAAYPHILRWFGRLRALPGYVGMPGLWEG